MFKKLISNLPFNPSLIDQVSFYARRLRNEQKIRRSGAILMILAMLVQSFAVISPPQPSLAASANDIVYGGFNSANELANTYESGCDSANRCDIKQIFQYFGISNSDQIRAGKMVTITDVDQYHTYGRTVSSKGYIRQHNANGATIYERNLGVWSPRNWQALEVINDRGHKVWILSSCGNPTTTPQGDPNLHIHKNSSPISGEEVMPGQEINYSLVYRNVGNNLARNFNIRDSLPEQVEFLRWGNFSANKTRTGNNLVFFHGANIDISTIGTTANNLRVSFIVKVDEDAQPGRFCNTAIIAALGQNDRRSNEVCHQIIERCPFNPNISINDPRCEEPSDTQCSSLSATFVDRNRVRFNMSAAREGTASINSFKLDLGDGQSTTQSSGQPVDDIYTATYVHKYPTEGPRDYTARLTVDTSLGDKTSSSCVQQITVKEPGEPIIVINKSVSNDTKGQQNAHNQIADPGDELIYTITAENIGDAGDQDFQFPEDDVTSILDYADIIDLNGGELVEQGGITKISWGSSHIIEPNETVSKEFRVKIKQELPQTNTPESDPDKFNCQITNTINGENNPDNTVTVKFDFVECKPIEQIVTTLPKTGPNTSLLATFVLVVGVSFFLARTALIRKELSIIKNSYTSSGGT